MGFAVDPVIRKTTSGGVLCRIPTHMVKHWSTTWKCITLSSDEAELSGVVKCVAAGVGSQALATDTASALLCRGTGRVRHLAVGKRSGAVTLYNVGNERNPTDLDGSPSCVDRVVREPGQADCTSGDRAPRQAFGV